MRQSNGHGSVRILCGSLSQHLLPPARHQPHPLTASAQRITQKETKNTIKRSNSQQIESYCLELHMQKPGLREVDLEPSPKRGNCKINRLRPRRKKTTESILYHTAWTHKREPNT